MAGFRPSSKSGSGKKHASAGEETLVSMVFNMFAHEEEDEEEGAPTDGNPVMIGLTGNDFPSYCAL